VGREKGRRSAACGQAGFLTQATHEGTRWQFGLRATATNTLTGRQVGPHLERLHSLRSSGQSVVIDGRCLSACTMVLGMIPRDRICVTSRARLGFHAAWRLDQAGRQISAEDGTELLMSVYPQLVRDWISRRGGLSPRLIYLSGGELASVYPSCNAGDWHPGRAHGH
jgi:hypothetical protein